MGITIMKIHLSFGGLSIVFKHTSVSFDPFRWLRWGREQAGPHLYRRYGPLEIIHPNHR